MTEPEPLALDIEWIPAAVQNTTSWVKRKVLGIVLHSSEGSFEATVSWFKNPSSNVSAHYVIGKTGRVVQMARDVDIAFHARGTWMMLPDCLKALPDPVYCSRLNAYSIGIELELLATDPDGNFPDAQYDALQQLLVLLAARHSIKLTREWVKGHGELQDNRTDPRGFDWTRIGL